MIHWKRTTTTSALLFTLALGACAVSGEKTESAGEPNAAPTPLAVSLARSIAKGDARISQALRAGGNLVQTDRGFASSGSKDLPTSDLAVEVSRLASETSRLSLRGANVELKPRGAAASVGVLSEGVALFKEAYPGTDRLVATTPSMHEELFLLRTPTDQATFEWDVDFSEPIHASWDGTGGLSFLNASGKITLHVPAPYAIDSKGARRDATLAWNSETHRLGVTLAHASNLSFPVLLDPSFEVYVWQKMGVPPAADTSVMAFDTARGRSVLISRGVTWTSNGLGWTRASESGPSGRDLTAAVYDPSRSRVVLFGGLDGTASNSTWEWDGLGWSQQFPVTSPSARYGHALAYDPVRGTVLLFGGTTGSGAPLSDTWEWNGKAWSQITVAGPSGRAGHAMALDADRKKIVLFGGGTMSGKSMATANAETWEWDGAAWAQKSPATSPSARGLTAMTYDTQRKRVALFAGEANSTTRSDEYWEWDGTTWAKATPPATRPSTRSGAAFAYDPIRKTGTVFGGITADNRTWQGIGTTWNAISAGTDVGQRHSPGLVYDSLRKKVVLLGGSAPNYATAFLTEQWEWDGLGWTKSAAVLPKSDACNQTPTFNGFDNKYYCWGPLFANGWFTSDKRFGAAVAFDAKRGVTVMFGGTVYNEWWITYALVKFAEVGFTDTPDGPGGSALAQSVSDTFTFNGTTWTNKTSYQSTSVPSTSPPSPPARREAAMVFVPGLDKIIMFGGGGFKTTAYNDTWSWDGTTWALINPVGGVKPPARGSHAMAYDANRKKIVIFGGSLSTGFTDQRNDTWEFDPFTNTWTQKNPTRVPAADAFPAADYDPIRKAVVLFTADAAATTGSMRTWVWDGSDWTDTTVSSSPPLRRGAKVVYDGAHNQFVMAGGADPISGQAATGDTWTLYTRGQDCTANSDCGTGYCTDGVCCEVPSCGSCEACNVAGAIGTCSKIRNATDDSCTGSNVCDKDGICRGALGQTCSKTSDCASGFCVDGVCCDTECKGNCQACVKSAKQSGESGTCGPAKDGADPHNDCASEEAATCGHDGQCDGNGKCRLFAAGTSCATATKVSACVQNRAVGWVCNGLGTCGNTVDGTDCAPYVCNLSTGGCTSTCERDIDCVDTAVCELSSGKCVAKGGAICKDDKTLVDPNGAETDCTPFKCEGGACAAITVCLDDKKTLLKADKTYVDCSPFECVGDRCNPITVCKDDGRTLQKEDGTQVDCSPFTCVGNKCNAVTVCLADGHSLLKEDGETIDCAPFACAGNACVQTCSSLAQCASPAICGSDGKCVAPDGADASGGSDGGGCGCVTAPASPTGSAVGLVFAAGFAMAALRRRREGQNI